MANHKCGQPDHRRGRDCHLQRDALQRQQRDHSRLGPANAAGHGCRAAGQSLLVMPTLKMAEAAAAEWDAQGDKIDPMTMPVTRSVNAALDKVFAQKDEVTDLIAAYGDSDLICYRADAPQALVDRQAVAWDPLVDWSRRQLNAPLVITQGVIHRPQDAATLSRFHDLVGAFDHFQLTAFHDLVSLSGSLVIGFAATHDLQHAQRLWEISRIDEAWQEEQWGEDEEASRQANLRFSAFLHADTFYRLCG